MLSLLLSPLFISPSLPPSLSGDGLGVRLYSCCGFYACGAWVIVGMMSSTGRDSLYLLPQPDFLRHSFWFFSLLVLYCLSNSLFLSLAHSPSLPLSACVYLSFLLFDELCLSHSFSVSACVCLVLSHPTVLSPVLSSCLAFSPTLSLILPRIYVATIRRYAPRPHQAQYLQSSVS